MKNSQSRRQILIRRRTMPPPVSNRFTTSPESPPPVDHSIKILARTESVCPSVSPPVFPSVSSQNSSPASVYLPTAGHTPSASSLVSLSNDNLSSPCAVPQKPLSCPESAPALFTVQASGFPQIPAASVFFDSVSTPIWNHNVQTIPASYKSAPTSSCCDGNFKSTTTNPNAAVSSTLPSNSGAVQGLLSNSSSQMVRVDICNTSVPSISDNRTATVNAQFPPLNRFPPFSLPFRTPPPPGSNSIDTGFIFSTTSPSTVATPTCESGVNPAESNRRSGSAASAVHPGTISVSSPAANTVVPPLSFRDVLAPPSPRTVKSFDTILESMDLPEPTLLNGIPGILIPEKVISSLVESFRFALVGKISGNRSLVPNSSISAAFAKMGLMRSFDLKFLPGDVLVINLSCEEDFARLWTSGKLYVGSIGIRFSKWTPESTFQEESPIAPVWVRFPELPLHLFEKSSLFAIAKILGKPVKIDDFRADVSRAAFARVCVEINVLEPLIKQVWVGWGEHTQEIDVVYERIPDYCIECKMFGHSTSVCYSHGKNPRPSRVQPSGQAPRPSGQAPRPVDIPSDFPSKDGVVHEPTVGSPPHPKPVGNNNRSRRRRSVRQAS